jgi:colanic acid/amylovoran biosynthesis glycosyltransferase
MKIAFIVFRFPVLSETFILNQITGLIDMGHEIKIFAQSKSNEKITDSSFEKYELIRRTHYFNMPKNRIKRIFKAIYLIIINFHKNSVMILESLNIFKYGKDALSLKLLYVLIPFLNEEFDIIHCHFGPNGFIGIYLREIGIKGKIITTFHGFDMSSFISSMGNDVYNDLFLKVDLCLPISDYWKKKLIELGCDEGKIMIHHMGIDLEKFEYYKREIQFGESIKVLTVGRLVEKKGHKYAIEAIAEEIKKHKNVEYLIVGDGPLRYNLEGFTLELGIENHIKFLGAIEQDSVLKLYQEAHIFILPSITANDGDQEGIPVVLMEAQAVGLPIVSTYHSGIPEVVLNSKSGFLVPERDVDELAKSLEYLINHPEIRQKMGKIGREIVAERYDIRKLNLRLVKIYETLLTGNED